MEIWQMFLGAFVLFVIIGLPFLSRYAPYLKVKDDVSDPTADLSRYEESKGKSIGFVLLRAVIIYVAFLLLMILINLIYNAAQ